MLAIKVDDFLLFINFFIFDLLNVKALISITGRSNALNIFFTEK